MEEQKCQRVARVGWPQGYLKAYAGYAAIFFVFMCRKHKMLQIKSNGTVSNYDTVPLGFTCNKSPTYTWKPKQLTAYPCTI